MVRREGKADKEKAPTLGRRPLPAFRGFRFPQNAQSRKEPNRSGDGIFRHSLLAKAALGLLHGAMQEGKRKKATHTAQVAAAVTTSAVSLAAMTALPPQFAAAQDQARLARTAWDEFSDDECYDKYFLNEYDYVDAVVLAAYWGERSPDEAKLRLGGKMLAFGPGDGDIHMRLARGEAAAKPDEEVPVWYAEVGYSYEDAELLAQYWGNELWDTKVTMNRLLAGGHEEVLQAALRSADPRG